MNASAKQLFAACAALTLGLAGQVHGATATATFDVNIALTATCQISTPPSAMSFTYTALQATVANATASFGMKCTNLLPVTSVTVDRTSVTDSATNLVYTLSMTGVPATGTGLEQTVSIAGRMASGQAGNCAAATCTNSAATNKQRSITITY